MIVLIRCYFTKYYVKNIEFYELSLYNRDQSKGVGPQVIPTLENGPSPCHING